MKRFFKNIGVFISVVISILIVLFLVGYCIFQLSVLGKNAVDKHVISHFKSDDQAKIQDTIITKIAAKDTIKAIICNYPVEYKEANLQFEKLKNKFEMPYDTVALQFFYDLKKLYLANVEVKDIISKTRLLVCRNQSEECLFACYQVAKLQWIAFLASCSGKYQMYMIQVADNNVVTCLKMEEFFKYMPNQITFYDGYFKYNSDAFYGNTYCFCNNKIIQCQSQDYCLYMFKSQKMQNVLGKESSFSIIRNVTDCQYDWQNSLVDIKSKDFGLCLKNDDNNFFVARVGDAISNVIKYPFVTYFSECDNSVRKTIKNGKLYITRNVFVNKEERLAGYAEFTAKNENSKIETFKLFVEHY